MDFIYRNTIINQSARVFSLSYSLNIYNILTGNEIHLCILIASKFSCNF